MPRRIVLEGLRGEENIADPLLSRGGLSIRTSIIAGGSPLTCFRFSGPVFVGKFQLAACLRAVERGRTMRRSKFTEAQIAFILQQAEGQGLPQGRDQRGNLLQLA